MVVQRKAQNPNGTQRPAHPGTGAVKEPAIIRTGPAGVYGSYAKRTPLQKSLIGIKGAAARHGPAKPVTLPPAPWDD